ncbi:hypothetical protein [Luteibacter sp. CQ10]|uniref:hypothetical protein n=1 Tax=Luteibacter sp. CQ10 TaxID=2805821 RepID=UPI0034A167B2
MLNRQMCMGVLLTLSGSPAAAQQVIELPGVHASAERGCVEPGDGSSAGALSYACLNTMVATQASGAPVIPGADVTKRPTNSLGLYNASGLRNRMGPNLGISVQPYRPKPAYPSLLPGR